MATNILTTFEGGAIIMPILWIRKQTQRRLLTYQVLTASKC